MEVRVHGAQFFIDGFPVRKSFFIKDRKRLLSYIAPDRAGMAEISEAQGEIRIQGDGLCAVYWKKGLELFPERIKKDQPTIREEFRAYGQPVFISVSESESGSTVSIEGSIQTRFPLKCAVKEPKIQIITGQSAAIVDLRGKTASGDYLALFSLPRGGAKLLLEGEGEIETRGNDVIIKESLGDLRGRLATSHYVWQGNSFLLSERTFERKEVPRFTRENAGRLLLEAIRAKDKEDALSYLAPDIADEEDLFRYFGEIEWIRDPLFSASETALAVEREEGGRRVALTFDFEFENGKITNILGED